MSRRDNKSDGEEADSRGDGSKEWAVKGGKISFQPVVPKFLQTAYGQIHSSGKKLEKSDLPYEPEDRPDTEEDQPTLVADDFMKEQLKQQEEKQKVVQSQLEEERKKNEEQRVKKTLMEVSKFSTDEATTHIFKVPTKETDSQATGAAKVSATTASSSKKRKGTEREELDDLANERRKKPSTPATKNSSLLSFADEEEQPAE